MSTIDDITNKKKTLSDIDSKEIEKMIGITPKFALLNRLITRDLNNYRSSPTFYKYTKQDIQKYIKDPYHYEKELRRALQYVYIASPHFRRVIQYFTGLTLWAYTVEPYRIDPKKANIDTVSRNYRKVLNMLASMNIKTQCAKILTVCLREDVFYGTFWITSDNITIQQLPSDFCAITTVEGNVPNVTFNFSYFSARESMLDFYPEEFRTKYNWYRENRTSPWIELDAPRSFAIKATSDILDYPIPPFAGLLREIYDIEDFTDMKLAKTALDNYAMLAMTLPMDDEGNWLLDYDKAKDFWYNLDSVLPDEIGSVLTPMSIDKISFERSNNSDSDTISEAEQNLFTAAGVSSLLFNNAKASANALLLSIKVDQELTYGIVKSIGDAINRLLQSQTYGKYFRVNFLNVSEFNKKDAGEAYIKAASYGFPTISMYAASQGLDQAEIDSMSFLEGTVLQFQDWFRPIQSSTQMSIDDSDSTPGAPRKDMEDLSDSREVNQEEE